MEQRSGEMTRAEAAATVGSSVTWLKTHECGWCGQSALNALRYGCAAFGEKCQPAENIRAAIARAEGQPT